jgi:hypothetical protein
VSEDKPQSFNDVKAYDDAGGFARPQASELSPALCSAEWLAGWRKGMTDAAEIVDPNSNLAGPRVWLNDVMREQRNAIIVARDGTEAKPNGSQGSAARPYQYMVVLKKDECYE